jgi:hypothetical protein
MFLNVADKRAHAPCEGFFVLVGVSVAGCPSEFSLDYLAASRYISTLFCEKRLKTIEKVGYSRRSPAFA